VWIENIFIFNGLPELSRDLAGCPSAGINRHVVGNERVLQERSSEPT
jgi:hypothetical protein